MSSNIKLVALAALFAANICSADIVPLVLDATIPPKDRASERSIIAAHKAYPNVAGSSKAARLAILESLTGRAGEMFYLEGEGEGYVDARFDNKRNPIWLRIWYSDKYIQIRFLDGQRDFTCALNRDGVCYRNHSHYYHYLTYLQKNIRRKLSALSKNSRKSVDELDEAQGDADQTDEPLDSAEKP